jgi:bacterioferritin
MPTKKQIESVVAVLNQARSMELHAITQYMNHHFGLDGQDYGKLASAMKKIAIDEMKHAETLAERIKDIDGSLEPTTTFTDKVVPGQKVEEMFGSAAKAEETTIEKYGEFAKICRDNNDPVSALLFERLAVEKQEHLNYFADTADHIKKLGNTFLNRQIKE